eukprot:5557024-Alexandrium_andersonii.AAC.1
MGSWPAPRQGTEELAGLPAAAIEELLFLLGACERAGWPPALKRWPQVHIPKDQDDEVPLVTRLRPIAIAPVV